MLSALRAPTGGGGGIGPKQTLQRSRLQTVSAYPGDATGSEVMTDSRKITGTDFRNMFGDLHWSPTT